MIYFPVHHSPESNTYRLMVGKNKLLVASVTVEDWSTGGVIGNENNKALCTSVTTEAQLRAAFEQGGDVKLEADITLSSALSLSDSQKTITLDLNNHTLSNNESNDGQIVVVDDGSLTIKNGTMTAEGETLVISGGFVNVENCTLNTLQSTYVVYNTGGNNTFYKNCKFKGGFISVLYGTVSLQGAETDITKSAIYVKYTGKVICDFDPTSSIYTDWSGKKEGTVTQNDNGTWTVTAAN